MYHNHKKQSSVAAKLWSVVLLVVCVITAAAVCPLDPGQKTLRRSPGDGGFQITISGDPTSFVAQSVYVGKNLSISTSSV